MTLQEEIIARLREDKDFQKHWPVMWPKLLNLILGMQQEVTHEERPADLTPEEHDASIGRHIGMLTNLTETLGRLSAKDPNAPKTPERKQLHRQHDHD